MRVWVTRAQPAAEATAERLRALGHDPIVAPLLTVRPIAGVRLDLSGVAALAFTSANGVSGFAGLSRLRDLPVFTVGEATAAAARAAGFAHVASADGDVHALARLIAAEGKPAGEVFHPGAREPAGDLAAVLTAAGIPARGVAVYRTEPATALPRSVADTGSPDAVLLHSPKAARILADLLPEGWAQTLDALALSPACAAPLAQAGLRRVAVARRPNETELLALLIP